MSQIDVLISNCNQALQIILQPNSSAGPRAEAQKFCDEVHNNPASLEIGCGLLKTGNASCMHFGCQLLVSSVKQRWNTWDATAKSQFKDFVMDFSNITNTPPYVKSKFADCIVEVARREWPQQWPNFLSALMQTGQAETTLLVLRTLVDAVAEETKDLPPARRKEVIAGLSQNKNDIFRLIKDIMSLQNRSDNLTKEAMLFIRSLSMINQQWLRDIVSEDFDSFIRSQLANDFLREEALLTFSDWANTQFFKKGSGQGYYQCFEKTIQYFAEIGTYAKFDVDCDYGIHRHIASMMKDLTANNADNIIALSAESQLRLWRSIYDIALYYPSIYVSYEALYALIRMVKPVPSLSQASYIKLEEIWILSFLRSYQPLKPGATVTPMLSQFYPQPHRWFETLAEFAERDHEQDSSGTNEVASTTVGLTKGVCLNLLVALCEIEGAPYFTSHVEHTMKILDKLIGEPQLDYNAIDSCLSIAERLGATLVNSLHTKMEKYQRMLKTRENNVGGGKKKNKGGGGIQEGPPPNYEPILLSYLQFIEKVLGYDFLSNITDFSGTDPLWLQLEIRRLETIKQASSIFHFHPAVVPPVIQFLFQRIERYRVEDNEDSVSRNFFLLSREAIQVLIVVSKNGKDAVTVHLNDLIAKTQQIYPRLAQSLRALLVQSLVAAASADAAKQGEVIQLVLGDDVNKFTGPEMTEIVRSGPKLEAMFQPSKDPQVIKEPTKKECVKRMFPRIREFWGILYSFSLVIQLSEAEMPKDQSTEFVPKRHAAHQLIASITPNVLTVTETFCNHFKSCWLQPQDPPMKELLLSMGESQWLTIVGNSKKSESGQTGDETFPVTSEIHSEARMWIYQIRFILFKLLGQMMIAGDGFWSVPVLERIVRITKTLHVTCPFYAVVFHKYVCAVFQQKTLNLTIPWMEQLAQTLIPVICETFRSVGEKYRLAVENRDPLVMRYPVGVQGVIMQMVVLLYKQIGTFLSQLCLGPKGRVQTTQVADGRGMFPKSLEELNQPGEKQFNTVKQPGGGDDVNCWLDAITRNENIRKIIQETAYAVIRFPDVRAVQGAVHCFKILAAQTWSLGILAQQWRRRGLNRPTARDIVSEALQRLDNYVPSHFRPLLEVATSPTEMKEDSPFYSILHKQWADHVADTQICGKIACSAMLNDISHAIYIGLMTCVRLFQMQLDVLETPIDKADIKICQPLLQAFNMLCHLPNTSENDVVAVIKYLLDKDMDQDDAKTMVRNIVRAAAPNQGTVQKGMGEILNIPTLEMDSEYQEPEVMYDMI